MCTQVPRLVYLSGEHLSVSFVTVRSGDNLVHMFLIDLCLAHWSLVLWRKCNVQEAARRHFSWKKEVMFFYFIVHKQTSKDWHLFLLYGISKFNMFWIWQGALPPLIRMTSLWEAEGKWQHLWVKEAEIAFPGFLALEIFFDWAQNICVQAWSTHDVIFLSKSRTKLQLLEKI